MATHGSATDRYTGAVIMMLLFVLLLPAVCRATQETFTLRPYHRQHSLTGFTRPISEKTITSEVSGICTAIVADIGDTIASDGQLAEVDTTFILLDIKANQLARRKVRRQLSHDEKSLKRFTKLRRKESTPEATLDDAKLAVDLQKLSLQSLENDASRLRENLAKHTLKAPPGWQLIKRYIEAEEFLQAGKPVARLGDFRQLTVPLAVDYNELQAISASQPLKLLVPDLDRELTATLYQISPAFDPATRKIPLKLRIEPPADLLGRLRGGMRVELLFESLEKTGNFQVPNSALISSYDATWLVREDGTRVQVLPLGIGSSKAFTILSGKGLAPGQIFLRTPAAKRLHQDK